MLQFSAADLLFLLPFCISLILITFAYFKYSTPTIFNKGSNLDKRLVKTSIVKKNFDFNFVRFIIVVLLLLHVQIIFFKGYTGVFFYNHFILSEFLYKYLLFFLKVEIMTFIVIYNISLSRTALSVDYVYSIAMLLLISPLIFFSNNFFIFYFLLELIVCLTFYKFSVSRFFLQRRTYLDTGAGNKYVDYTPRMLVNTMFFQYWASFFSSIILLFFFIKFEFYFNSTEWTFVSLANNFVELPKAFFFYFFFFIIAFFLKLGITPAHMYKIEIYKGLPYISIYLYTVIFFFIYFYFFIYLFVACIGSFYAYFWLALYILIIGGVLFLVNLLFDINFLKSFFAYSTIVNVVSFILVLLTNY